MKKKHTSLESKIHNEAIGCRKMIIIMITQALEDIKQKRNSPSYLLNWKHAYKWILSDSFEYWCDLIDFDWQTIREQVICEVK